MGTEATSRSLTEQATRQESEIKGQANTQAKEGVGRGQLENKITRYSEMWEAAINSRCFFGGTFKICFMSYILKLYNEGGGGHSCIK